MFNLEYKKSARVKFQRLEICPPKLSVGFAGANYRATEVRLHSVVFDMHVIVKENK